MHFLMAVILYTDRLLKKSPWFQCNRTCPQVAAHSPSQAAIICNCHAPQLVNSGCMFTSPIVAKESSMHVQQSLDERCDNVDVGMGVHKWKLLFKSSSWFDKLPLHLMIQITYMPVFKNSVLGYCSNIMSNLNQTFTFYCFGNHALNQ